MPFESLVKALFVFTLFGLLAMAGRYVYESRSVPLIQLNQEVLK